MKRKILDKLTTVMSILAIIAIGYIINIRHVYGKMILTKEIPCAIIILIGYVMWVQKENRD